MSYHRNIIENSKGDVNENCSRVIFASLRCALMGEKLDGSVLERVSNEEWERIYRVACSHSVAGMMMEALGPVQRESEFIPRGVWMKWVAAVAQFEVNYEARCKVIAELAAMYAKDGIDLMVLKGYGLSMYYPSPKSRRFSDIDIYLGGTLDENEASDMRKRGDSLVADELGLKVDTGVHHHTTFVFDGILVENHFDFINTRSHTSNVKIEGMLKELVRKDVRTAEIGGVRILTPGANFNALFLMRHMVLHFSAERISLKFLTDWLMFLRAERENVDFELMFSVYKRFNMNRFVNAVNGILIEFFDMPEDWVPDFERDEDLELRILSDILNPEFAIPMPKSKGFLGFCNVLAWKFRRYFANRWKHAIVYNESWFWTFFRSAWAHVEKPKTIAH